MAFEEGFEFDVGEHNFLLCKFLNIQKSYMVCNATKASEKLWRHISGEEYSQTK